MRVAEGNRNAGDEPSVVVKHVIPDTAAAAIWSIRPSIARCRSLRRNIY